MNDFFPLVNELVSSDQRVECLICHQMKSKAETIVINCAEKHLFCYDCIILAVDSDLSEHKLPHCPECENFYNFSVEEYAYIMSKGDLNDPRYNEYCEKYDDYIMSKYLNDFVVKCCYEDCDGDIIVSRQIHSLCIPLKCPICQRETCSFGGHEGHYNCNCDEYKQLKMEYDQWKFGKKEQRYEERCKFDTKLNGWLVDKAAFEIEKKRKNDNYQAEYETERQLALTARLCPKCKRTIQKVDGCDLMICGRNYHGGDNQDGCGTHFCWSSALPYKPTIPSKSILTFSKQLPSIEDMVLHNKYFVCGLCKTNTITGIRFTCLNCPTFYLCEQCEHNRIKEHFMGQHIFKLCTADFTF